MLRVPPSLRFLQGWRAAKRATQLLSVPYKASCICVRGSRPLQSAQRTAGLAHPSIKPTEAAPPAEEPEACVNQKSVACVSRTSRPVEGCVKRELIPEARGYRGHMGYF